MPQASEQRTTKNATSMIKVQNVLPAQAQSCEGRKEGKSSHEGEGLVLRTPLTPVPRDGLMGSKRG